jgi:hypothetical protein
VDEGALRKGNLMKNFIKFMVFVMVFTMSMGVVALPAESAGVPMDITTVGTTAQTNAGGEIAASATATVAFSWGPVSDGSSQFASGDTIIFTATTPLSGNLAACDTATTDVDADGTPDGSFAFGGVYATYTFSAATTEAATSALSLCIKVTSPATPNNLSFFAQSTMASGPEDIGGTFLYSGDDNDVTVTAIVASELEFRIRNSADTADTNTCNLGVLSISSLSSCTYRLKVRTNASSGYQVETIADGDLRLSGSGDVVDSLDLDPIAEDGTVAAGTEGYGVQFYGGACTAGSITEDAPFDDDDTPVASNTFSGSTDTTNTALVDHVAAMDTSTAPGTYTQIVSYYVTASF